MYNRVYQDYMETPPNYENETKLTHNVIPEILIFCSLSDYILPYRHEKHNNMNQIKKLSFD